MCVCTVERKRSLLPAREREREASQAKPALNTHLKDKHVHSAHHTHDEDVVQRERGEKGNMHTHMREREGGLLADTGAEESLLLLLPASNGKKKKELL